MKVIDIVREWLAEEGYTGLCNPDAECGCTLNDFVPCGDICSDGIGGYTTPICNDCQYREDCGIQVDGGSPLVIGDRNMCRMLGECIHEKSNV